MLGPLRLDRPHQDDGPQAAEPARARITAAGLVQGVGFRPFVYRLASRLGLAGVVRNTSGGVEIEAEGSWERIRALVEGIRSGAPPLARIHRVDVQTLAARGERGFCIEKSESLSEESALISPDVATCQDCLRELGDPADRRHGYPFINCTDCGPRFTIIEGVPYDRSRTTMRKFVMCEACERQYGDPADRRFHAEPNACADCGPSVSLVDASGRELEQGPRAVEEARRELAAGRILAVKGLGGFHLACDAANSEAVLRLRRLKGRPDKPLALMGRDLEIVRAYCRVSESEARQLESASRPILLLARRDRPATGFAPLSPAVAPGRTDLGIMLPYTPLHHLLLQAGGPACLVMTSGNRSEEPIVIDDRAALERLGAIADSFLVHDRPIWNRADDSVGFVEGERLTLLRRSRGFAPLPIELPRPVEPTLALGAMYGNAFALAAGRRLFLSQHVGDVDNLETLTSLRDSIEKLRSWLRIDPAIVAHDLHPDLLTTRLAHELAGKERRRVAVQHHHAHFVSAVVAAGHPGEAQGWVLDGTGWGTDRTLWGCELLVGTAAAVRRAGHLLRLPLPGGEAAIRRPVRQAVAYLHVLAPEAEGAPLDLWRRVEAEEVQAVRRMVDRGFNAPETSSAGRLFDAVAALLGLRDRISYEGQAAIELEHLAHACDPMRAHRLHMGSRETDGTAVLDPAPLWHELVAALQEGVERSRIACGFHLALAEALAEASRRVRDAGGPKEVALCGGVFQNRLLLRLTAEELCMRGLRPLLPGHVPVNDAGLALGQVLVAAATAGGVEG